MDSDEKGDVHHAQTTGRRMFDKLGNQVPSPPLPGVQLLGPCHARTNQHSMLETESRIVSFVVALSKEEKKP